MSVTHDNPGQAVVAAEDIGAYLLVDFAGALCQDDAADDIFGVSTNTALAGSNCPIRYRSAGTWRCIAAEALAVGDVAYKDADGTVGATDTNCQVGVCLSAATAAGQEIEVYPIILIPVA